LPTSSCPAALALLCLPELLATYKITVIPHPPYSWGLVLFDFFLFPHLKKVLNVRIYHVTMNQAKYCDTLAHFKTLHFTNYFEEPKGEYFGGRQQWLEVLLWRNKLLYCTTQSTFFKNSLVI
jgi:hypothetical protein